MTRAADRRDLLERQIRNLFVVDEAGRMERVNEPGERQPPFFYMGRSADGCVGFVRAGTPDDVAERLRVAVRDERATADFSKPARALERAVEAARAAGLAGEVRRGPAYAALGEPRATRLAAEAAPAGGRRVHAWIAERWGTSTLPPLELAFGVVADGLVVALCHCARLGAKAAEAGVETAPEFRNRGYAAAATATWVAAVRSSGREAFYSTDRENTASQGVARRVGLELIGELSSVS